MVIFSNLTFLSIISESYSLGHSVCPGLIANWLLRLSAEYKMRRYQRTSKVAGEILDFFLSSDEVF